MTYGRRLVCIGCRAVDPPDVQFMGYRTIVRKYYGSYDERIYTHKPCGEEMQLVSYRWCPPKKNNDRAWKRVARGDWLWDHRRIRRVANDHTDYWWNKYRARPKVDLGG